MYNHINSTQRITELRRRKEGKELEVKLRFLW